MRKSLLIFTAFALAGLVFSAFLAAGNVNKLSAYGYIGRSGDVSLIVDMDLARYRGDEKYVPLLIWLGHTENKTLYANRGSFVLTDPKGARQPMAAPDEVLKNYGPSLVASDYTYVSRLPDYGGMVYLACRALPQVAFFPNPSGRPKVLYDQVELPDRTMFKAVVYFPNGAGQDLGTYTFTYDDPKSQTHIEVPFTIPWEKGK